jgi:hypothetical protein
MSGGRWSFVSREFVKKLFGIDFTPFLLKAFTYKTNIGMEI